MIIVGLSLLPITARAGDIYKVLGNQTIILTSGSATLSAPRGTYEAVVQVEDGDIRYWTDGTTPISASSGFLLEDKGSIALETPYEVEGFVAIVADGSSGVTIKVLYSGKR